MTAKRARERKADFSRKRWVLRIIRSKRWRDLDRRWFSLWTEHNSPDTSDARRTEVYTEWMQVSEELRWLTGD